jgi:WD40 repeat protein
MWAVASAARAQVHEERRERSQPALMVETGARLGACDVLTFTTDGRYLLAAGDDKVVRIWKVAGQGLELANTLRWSVWRERHGAIYALALSPDPGNRHVAIGGLGVRTGSVVVLDRATGQVVHALTDVKGNDQAIWSLTFAPSGTQVVFGTDDGSVWLWDLAGGQGSHLRKLGRHGGRNGVNRVCLVAFVGATGLVSAATDGTVLEWDTARPDEPPTALFRFALPRVFQVVLSSDHRWLAAGGENHKAHVESETRVEVASLDGRERIPIELPGDDLPHSLAFDRSGTRLAVGIRTVPSGIPFYKDINHHTLIFDLDERPPRSQPGPRPTFHPEALAFHPDGMRLAMAGGSDQEVTFWDLRRLADGPIDEVRSPGSGLWSVGLSRDQHGRYLGYRDLRVSDPPSPNRRGRGPWHTFDLTERKWVHSSDFEPIGPLETIAGWRVEPSRNNPFLWYAVGPDDQRHALDLDRYRDEMPQCYTFLRPDAAHGVRLAIGHYWGVSLFMLDEAGARRVRLYTGHQGPVTAVAPSPDGTILVTASRDQTIAAWSLADWPVHAQWGARFTERLGELRVEDVAPGSPAWETGLTDGDDIVAFAYDAQLIEGGPKRWLRYLKRATGGLEYFFLVQRPGEAKKLKLRSTLRQRPLWCFFPTRAGEWVLWRWRDYYYDTSTGGDSLIGWQLGEDVSRRPEFYPARQFEEVFHQPDKVAEVLRQTRFAPATARLPDVQPPAVEIQADRLVVQNEAVVVTLMVTPRGPRESQQLKRVKLWIGDCLFRQWTAEQLSMDGPFRETIVIPSKHFRHGVNRVIAQCDSQAGTTAKRQLMVRRKGEPTSPRVFLLLAGVAKYDQAGPLPRGFHWDNLPGIRSDLVRMRNLWRRLNNQPYSVVASGYLLDEEATPAAICGRLDEIARESRPDDLLVLFLGGHGYAEGPLEGAPLKRGTFTFVGPFFDVRQPKETGLTSERLYQNLIRIPCRKLVLLNACHSGDVTTNPVRDLSPDGVGPTILSACEYREPAFVEDAEGGPFAQAIEEALNRKFDRADRDHNHVVDSYELVLYVRWRVPQLMEDLKREDPKRFNQGDLSKTQTPTSFPDDTAVEAFPLARQASP